MSIALIITDRNCDSLVKEILSIDPSLKIQVWPDIIHPDDVEFAVLWKQPANYLNQFTKLKAVTSLGAGTDFIESDPSLSSSVPILKIVTNGLKQQMAQYVLSYLLEEYRNHSLYRKQQKSNEWNIIELPESFKVGFLGLGEIAEFVAQQIKTLGFDVQAWTRSQIHPTIPCHHGQSGLEDVLSSSDCVVSLLPLNASTHGLINFQRFSLFKKESMLIQAGRGGQVVETDLIKALDEGLLKRAVLDVFQAEPLPKDNALWNHPKITITPHNSARSDSKQTAEKIVEYYLQLKSH
jgi:glyoxylate/hydroxypyruvate reductase A